MDLSLFIVGRKWTLHLFFLWVLTVPALLVSAQSNITRVEYYVDIDPGYGNGTQLPLTSGTDFSNLSINLDPSSLSSGVHQLGARALDANGNWSLNHRWLFFKPYSGSSESAPLPNLSYIEYYIDTDPGHGKATPVPVNSTTNAEDVLINLNPAELSSGVHHLGVRAKDISGNWSLNHRWLFFKPYSTSSTATPLPDISYAEWYINTDPGYGKATSTPIAASGNLSDLLIQIDPATLSSGVHQFGFRAKDANGAWSLDHRWLFFKPYGSSTSASNKPNIAYAEWFIDADPGYGKGTSLSVAAGVDLNNLLIQIDPATLNSGVHQLSVRAKDANGAWSLDNRWLFFKPYSNSTTATPVPDIKRLEYYIDIDPGYGRAVPVDIKSVQDIKDLAVAVDVNGLPQGSHTLYLRAQDASGSWSLTNSLAFTVDEIIQEVPTITTFFPKSGAAGATITLKGTNFSGNPASNVVYFGAVKATVLTASDTALTVTVPAGATCRPITVTIGGLTAQTVVPFNVTFEGGAGFIASTFAPKVDFPSSVGPVRVHSGDLDGDGKVDLITSSYNGGANLISVFRNTSNGSLTLATRIDLTTQLDPEQIAVADMDGDGKLDVVVLNTSSNTYSIFRNISVPGAISFATRVDFALGYYSDGLAVADLDKDGKPDIVISKYATSGDVSVFRNISTNGNFAFASKVSFPTGANSTGIATADLDEDGRLDLAVSNYNSSSVSVLKNQSTEGTISFDAKIDISVAEKPWGIALGDLDGDDKIDIVTSNLSGSTSVVRNLSSNGVMAFDTRIDYPVPGAVYDISLANLDGDGKVDLALASTSGNISVLKNNSTLGSILFSAKVDYANAGSSTGVTIVDMDNDNLPDLAATNSQSNLLSLFKNTLRSAQTIVFDSIPRKVFGDPSFVVKATASSGLSVNYVLLSGPGQLNGDTITITGAGTIVVKAIQAGNAAYDSAEKEQSIMVDKAAATITLTNLVKTYNGAEHPPTVTTQPVGLPYVLTFNGAPTIPVNAGKYEVVATINHSNYSGQVKDSFQITKASQVITLTPTADKEYGTPKFKVQASASSGLPVSLTISTEPSGIVALNGDSISITGLGFVYLEAAQGGDNNYNMAPAIRDTFEIVKAKQTVTFTPILDKALGDPPFKLSAIASSGLPVTYEINTIPAAGVASLVDSTVTLLGDTGTVTIKALQTGNEYYSPSEQQRTFKVLPAPKKTQVITFSPIEPKVYGDTAFLLSASASSGLLVMFRSISGPAILSGDTIMITGAGTITIEANQPGNDAYHPAEPVQQNIIINKASQTIAFDPIPDKKFGDAPFLLNAKASSGLPVLFQVINGYGSITDGQFQVNGAGSVTIRAYQGGNKNYAAAQAERSFCIAPPGAVSISGYTKACISSQTYSVVPVNGVTYNWLISGGGILSSSKGNSVNISWASVGTHTIKVWPVTSCETSATDTSTLQVQVAEPVVPDEVTNLFPLEATVIQNFPFSLSWKPSDQGQTYDLFVWSKGSTEPQQPFVSNTQHIAVMISPYLLPDFAPGKIYNWKVVARNGCRSSAGVTQSFAISELPNLVLKSVQAPPSAFSGQALDISVLVKNEGKVSTRTGQWTDAVYLSADTVFNWIYDNRGGGGEVVDKYLGGKSNLSALEVGESYYSTIRVNLPENMVGQYYLVVVTNGFRSITEESTADNLMVRYLPINLTPPPDLQVTSVISPLEAFSNTYQTVKYSVKNKGSGVTRVNHTKNQKWRDVVYLSADPVFDINTAVKIGEGYYSGKMLEPDSVYTNTVPVLLPLKYFGQHYIFVITDADKQVYEFTFENNNSNRNDSINIFLTPPPDFVLTNWTPPAKITPGEKLSINYTIRNQGATKPFLSPQANLSWIDAVYISKESIFNNKAVAIGFTVPNMIEKTCYVMGSADVNSSSSSSSSGGGGGSSSESFVGAIKTNFSNKYPNTSSSEKEEDEGIPVNYLNGNLEPPRTNVFWYDRDNLPWFYQLAPCWSYCYPEMLPEEGYSSTMPGRIIDTLSGTYYLYFFTDITDTVFEYNKEKNNIVGVKVEVVNPDLQVSSIEMPAATSSGNTVTLGYTIKNEGQGRVIARTRKDFIWFSSTPSLDTNKAILVDSLIYNSSMDPGASLPRQKEIKIPDGIEGIYYLFVVTDYYNKIFEKDKEDNNIAMSGPIQVTLTPWPDLQFTTLALKTDTAVLDEDFHLQFEVQNKGIADIIGKSWIDSIFISSDTVWKRNSAVPMKGLQKIQALMMGDSYSVNASLRMKVDSVRKIHADTLFYLYISLDDAENLYEHTGEKNNIKRIPVKLVKPDLVVNYVNGPDSAYSGQKSSASWSVTNMGGRTGYHSEGWLDKIYLSRDTVWDDSDTLAHIVGIRGPLKRDSSYLQSLTYTIPNGLSGNYYLFVGTDAHDHNMDRNRKNNYQLCRGADGKPKSMYITLTPPPDLVASIQAPSVGYSGQPITVKWKVENKGTGPTRAGYWRDAIYLAIGPTNASTSVLLKENKHIGDLGVGESYIDSADIFLPIYAEGNYFLQYKTDDIDLTNADKVYEHMNEDNNTTSSYLYVIRPLPADLIVSEFTIPEQVIAGDSIEIKWKVQNIGPNPATGYFKEGIYLSQDSLWNVEDVFLANPMRKVNLAPLEDTTMLQKVKVKGAVTGKYHIIIRTDLSNNIIELDENNNTTASNNKIDVSVLELPINVLTTNNIRSQSELYYRLEIPDSLKGETMMVSLKGTTPGAANELYIMHGLVPTRDKYHLAYDKSISENQDIVIPALDSGIYYILVYGSLDANISLLAKKIDFGIHSVTAKEGGNTGLVTVKMKGARFEPGMQVSLYDAQLGTISSYAIKFVNSTTLFVTFNLAGKDTGLYDVRGVNTAGKQTVISEGFRILKGPGGGFQGGSGSTGTGGFYCSIKNTAADELLGFDLQYPGSILVGLPLTITINFGNSGNVDIPAPARVLSSIGGLPISFTEGGVKNGETELYLEFKELDGPEGILRPGATGSIVIYSRATILGQRVYRLLE